VYRPSSTAMQAGEIKYFFTFRLARLLKYENIQMGEACNTARALKISTKS
jgi:hypothetical protein